jgi:hypothetical protein
MMDTKKLYRQTMPYTLARFGLALLLALLSGILMFVCLRLEGSVGASLAHVLGGLIGEDLGEDGPAAAVFCIWLCGTIGLHFIIMRYAGYLLKAGHIAVLSEALGTGSVPENQVAFGKQAVLNRFGAIHAYLVLDRLVDGAVSQLCKAVSKTGEAFEDIPGVPVISEATQLFLRIALGHVDACCLAFSFYRKRANPFQDAADGVVLYFQNWKTLLKTAGALTLACCGLYCALGIASLIVFACFMNDGTNLPAAYAGGFFFWVIKASLIDSWVMVKMVAGFFAEARDKEPAVDVYDKLAGLSGKFRELWQRAETAPRDEKGSAR